MKQTQSLFRLTAIITLVAITAVFPSGCAKSDENTTEPPATADITLSVTEEETTADKISAIESFTYSDELSVVFTKLPSPPTRKRITNPDEVKAIFDYIHNNTGELIKTYGENDDRPAGWTVFLRFSDGTQVSNEGENILINNSVYKVNNDFFDGLIAMYNSAEEQEE